MSTHRRWIRTAVMLLLLTLAWFAFCAGPGAGQEKKPELAWYGFVKMDAAWDEGLVDAGNYARWVVSDDVFRGHGHFNMTARQTRLGFTAVTRAGGATLTGRWEADFYGGGAENKNALQVRHAYVDAVWPSGWSVLAGQASDVISPLVPATLNYTVQWWAGNTGYRRPQVRVTRRVRMEDGKELRVEGAASRTIGDDFALGEPGDTGADSETPSLQWLVGLTLQVSGRPAGAGVFGHWGREKLHDELGGEEVALGSSGAGAYFTLPVGGRVTVSGEGWAGTNLDDYLGGVAQGIRVVGTTAREIAARGGWVELALRTAHGTHLHLGGSMDDPERADLGPGARDRNAALWTTLSHEPGGGLRYGLEISRWRTRYVGLADGASWRVQTAVVYSF